MEQPSPMSVLELNIIIYDSEERKNVIFDESIALSLSFGTLSNGSSMFFNKVYCFPVTMKHGYDSAYRFIGAILAGLIASIYEYMAARVDRRPAKMFFKLLTKSIMHPKSIIWVTKSRRKRCHEELLSPDRSHRKQ